MNAALLASGRFQTHHAFRPHGGGVQDARGQFQAVAGLHDDVFLGVGQVERDGAADDVEDFGVGMGMGAVLKIGAIAPGIGRQPFRSHLGAQFIFTHIVAPGPFGELIGHS